MDEQEDYSTYVVGKMLPGLTWKNMIGWVKNVFGPTTNRILPSVHK